MNLVKQNLRHCHFKHARNIAWKFFESMG
jgi:hypothetical protein